MSQSSRRSHLVGLLLVGLTPWLVFADALLPGRSFFYDDMTLYFYPIRALLARMGQEGGWTWWNPYAFCGVPLAGNVQAALFYPPNWLVWKLNLSLACSLYILFHLSLGGVFTYLLLREYPSVSPHTPGMEMAGMETSGTQDEVEGNEARVPPRMSWWACTLGGLTFALSGVLIAHIPRLNVVGVAAWLPGVLWTMERYARSQRLGWVALGGGFVGCILLAGFPQIAFYILCLIAMYGLSRTWVAPGGRPGRFVATALLLPLLLGLLIAGASLVPFVEIANQSPRKILRSHHLASYTVWTPKSCLAFLVPEVRKDVPSLVSKNVTDSLTYLGFVPLLMALASLRRPNRRVVFLWCCLILFAMLGLGEQGPLRRVLEETPGLNLFRLPERWLLLVDFCAALLAAHGLDGWMVVDTRSRPLERVEQTGKTDGLASSPLSTWLGGLVITALLVELGWMARLHSAVGSDPFYQQIPAPLATVLGSGQQPQPRFTTWPGQSLQQHYANAGEFFGLCSCIGSEALVIDSYVAYLFAAETGRLPNPADIEQLIAFSYTLPLTRVETPMARLMNLGYVIEPGPQGPTVRALPAPYPRAFLAERWRVVPRLQQLAILSDTHFDGRHQVLLESDPGLGASADTASEEQGEARFERWSSDELILSTRHPRSTVLFVSEAWFEGWEAEVDGKAAPLLRADVCFRGVALSPGRHQVHMRYRPKSVRYGLLATLVGLLSTAGLGLLGARARR